jgi:hypothetical protein
MTIALALTAQARTNQTHTKKGGGLMYVPYESAVEYDEYESVGSPPNLGHRRPLVEEWDDLVLEAQLLWVEVLAESQPEPPPKRGGKGRIKGSKNKPKPHIQAWLEQYLA